MNDYQKRPSMVTVNEGEKTIKVCTEDISKILERISESILNATVASAEMIKKVKDRKIIGIGKSVPCLGDAYDEEIGNNIAFMKAKLNANIKKHNLLCRIYNEYVSVLDKINEDLNKVDFYIKLDLNGVRQHNPDYLTDIETKLGL
jgi:uncharacterized protein YlaN (UPF0358 family)